MMNFQEFVEKVAEDLSYRIVGKVYAVPIMKNNGVTRTGLVVMSQESNVSPTIYLEEYYEEFRHGKCIAEVVGDIKKLYYENKMGGYFDVSGFVDKNKMMQRLSFKLINYEKNEQLLEKIPHRRFLDVAVVYYYFLESDEQGIATIQITNHHMNFWNITESEMYEFAYKNYLKLHPVHLQNVQELITTRIQANELSIEELQKEMNMLIVTSQEYLNGAIMMMFPEVLKPIAEMWGQDLYILPSSIHEVLVLPKSEFEVHELKEMVLEVNLSQETIEERLSDNVYSFSVESGNVEIA